MKKRILTLITVTALLVSCLVTTASAGYFDNTKNKINLNASCSGSFAYAKATCSTATMTCAVLSVYNDSGTRVDYQLVYSTTSEPTKASAYSSRTDGYRTINGSSATISGVATSGYTGIELFY